jgi:hypothetical protein
LGPLEHWNDHHDKRDCPTRQRNGIPSARHQGWLVCNKPDGVSRLLVVAPLDKAISDEITTLDLALTELLSVGKPDALGSCTVAR